MSRRRPASRTDVLLQLSITNAWVSQLFDHELVRRGIEPAQVGVLTLIEAHEPITPTGLEQELGLPGATLRERVHSLVDAGFVARVPNEQDGRSYFLETTPEGKALIRSSASALRAVERSLEDATGRKLEDLRDALETLADAARGMIKGELLGGPGSKTVGPW
ncbi:MAG: MarR family winged helix-turn-helix transcriptional regulator [Actinomycetota bacterium]